MERPGTRHCQLGIRWTIGDVNPEGFEALQLSIYGAWSLFGSRACYQVCVNSVGVSQARQQTGELPVEVEWREVSRADLPEFLRLGHTVAEGTGWKFCPLRAFERIPELALDNDCILWSVPPALERWLQGASAGLIAEDVRPHFGCFASRCGLAPRNSGIRGLAPEFPFEQVLGELMREGRQLLTEGDEQGLQVACLQARGEPQVVPVSDVAICSPFPPHGQALGQCGAHFVGLNTKHFGWTYYGQDPVQLTRAYWRHIQPALLEKLPGAQSLQQERPLKDARPGSQITGVRGPG